MYKVCSAPQCGVMCICCDKLLTLTEVAWQFEPRALNSKTRKYLVSVGVSETLED